MSDKDVKDLVKHMDRNHVEVLTKIEDVKEEVREVKVEVKAIKGMLGDPDEAKTIGG